MEGLAYLTAITEVVATKVEAVLILPNILEYYTGYLGDWLKTDAVVAWMLFVFFFGIVVKNIGGLIEVRY